MMGDNCSAFGTTNSLESAANPSPRGRRHHRREGMPGTPGETGQRAWQTTKKREASVDTSLCSQINTIEVVRVQTTNTHAWISLSPAGVSSAWLS